ncbi:MAG TPA: alpha/beta hydrolase-fold protein [Acidimicrobiia bacterium]|nr:alpha/beta hydrolase-fold protein [Acidimicrobiia bacterium]
MARWGSWGTPILVFPTAGGDAGEIERMGLIGALWGLIEGKRIKVYSCDSVAGRSWLVGADPRHSAWLQGQFDGFIHEELVPAIRADCSDRSIEIITAGASIGAFNAVASLCRHPWTFRAAIGMSGSYDLGPWLHGTWSDDVHYSSPIHFLPGLEGEQLDQLRRRFVVLATGRGRWENPGQTWKMAHALGLKSIPNRVDLWGHEHDHDWPTWAQMLPLYLDDLA